MGRNKINTQQQLFSYCTNYLLPVMDVAGEMQKEYGDINLRFSTFGDIGLYAAQVCANAITQQFHIEFDQGPTMIFVPQQNNMDRKIY